jgi:hypothetical protein
MITTMTTKINGTQKKAALEKKRGPPVRKSMRAPKTARRITTRTTPISAAWEGRPDAAVR